MSNVYNGQAMFTVPFPVGSNNFLSHSVTSMLYLVQVIHKRAVIFVSSSGKARPVLLTVPVLVVCLSHTSTVNILKGHLMVLSRDAQDRLLWRDKTCPART